MISFTSRSGTGLPQRIEALEQAVALASGRLDDASVAFGHHVVDKAADRLRHGTTNTLVALLGATGSGKSSLANAVVGDAVATTGVRRPTTSSTLACFWGDDDVQALLDWLEIKNRHRVGEVGELDGLVLLDVPDHDSIAHAHREEMERIAEHADMLLWVTDAEKYGDKAMHDYLARLSTHGAITALVLNKVDQLGADDTARCLADLKRLLGHAELGDVPVLAVSAVELTGLDGLHTLLVDTVKGQRAVVDRLMADTAMAADDLLDELGPSTGMTTVPDGVANDLTAELVGASGLAAVTAAVAAGHRRDATGNVGWPFTRWVRRLRPHPLGRLHLGPGSAAANSGGLSPGGLSSLPAPSGVQVARVAGAVRSANRKVTADLPDPWPALIGTAATPDQELLNRRVDTAVSESVRTLRGRSPRWWQGVNAVQLGLAAATIVGVVWLGLLAFAGYLRIPEPPTPEYRGFPLPTALLLGGILLGLLVSFVASRVAAVGASRRARAVERKAERAVAAVTAELITDPMQQELDRRQELRSLLESAGGGK